MKKAIAILLTVGIVLFVNQSEISAQCNPETYTDQCIPKLASGFNFLKSYAIDGAGGSKNKVEYSYVFTSGTQYMINICANGPETDGIVVTIYDGNRQEKVSSYINGSYISAISYPCTSTGIYYITYTFVGSSNYCGGSVLGFKR